MTSRVTTAGAYVETERFSTQLTNAGIYVETGREYLFQTSAGIYVETVDRQSRLTMAGMYIETIGYVLLPDEDVFVGDWVNETSGSSLAPSISELAPNDDTYVHQSGAEVGDYFEVGLYDTSDDEKAITDSIQIEWRAWNDDAGSTVKMKMQLWEGSNLIAEDERTLSLTPTTYIYTLTQQEYDKIRDDEDLVMRFIVTEIT